MGSCSPDDVVIKSPADRRLYRVLHLANGLTALLVHDPEIYSDGDDSGDRDGGADEEMEEGDEEYDDDDGGGDDDDDDDDDDGEDFDEEEEEEEEDEPRDPKKRKKGVSRTKKAAAAMCVGMGSFSDPPKAQGLAHFLEHMLFMGSLGFPDENEYDSYLSKHGGSSNAFTETEFTCYYFEVNREYLKGALQRFSQFFISPLVKVEAMEREVQAVDSEFNQVLQSDSCRLLQLHCHTASPDHPFNRFYWGNKKSLVDAMESGVNLREEILQLYSQNYHGGVMKLVVIGGEGKGSLLYFLKAKGWATALSAGVGEEGMRRSSIAYIFVMSIHLTDTGLDMIYEVIGAVYQYIKLLQQSSPQECIFKELQDIANMEFRYSEELRQDEYASELAENLFFYSEEHVIYGDYAFEQWAPELIDHVLSFFSPENMRIDVLSKSFDKQSQVIQHEPWFGSQYIEEDLPESLFKLWSNPPKIDPSLHLPSKNEFIACDFSLRNANANKNLADGDHPKCIIDKPFIKLWYKIDTTFNVPRTNAYFLIALKDGYHTSKNSVLAELFMNLLKDELNDILYQAGVAKLDTSLSIIADKLELKLYGFNDKLSILLSKILSLCRSFSPKSDRFEVIKEDMERAFRNTNMKPLSHALYLRLQILRETFWDIDDRLSCLAGISLPDLLAFIPNLLSQLHIEGLCHGNLSEEEAKAIADIFANAFLVQPLPMELRHQGRVLCLPSAAKLMRNVRVKNELEVNSVIELYFQIEQDIGNEATRLRAITDLFSSIIDEPYFNQLRTKEQLGYVVECGPRMTYRVLGFCFRVQSSEYSPLYLHERVCHFISGVQEILDGLDDESFEHHRSGLIAEKLEKEPSLACETGNHWTQIVDKRYCIVIHTLYHVLVLHMLSRIFY
ncbi:Insulysin protein [Dioscorea alata]|uniref:Insulysin protein n=1 Tax=Dioscorea alata TaxID=55571 RepID=A0ACB7VTL8_DIOAL|nr:Insulysin protein [Dioscorea alata]